MICPKCRFDQADGGIECPRCGIIFEKYLAALNPPPVSAPSPSPAPSEIVSEPSDRLARAKAFLLSVPDTVNPFSFAGRLLVYGLLVYWGWTFIVTPMETNYVGESFMHNINLPFHEAGHVIFSPFGRFLHVLGGSLGQILMPAICVGAFLIKNRDAFGASVGLWWVAENFMDLAPYINDARALELPLLGGVTGKDVEDYHDWELILRILGWTDYDHALAHASYNAGILLMLLAFAWGGSMLYLQWKRMEAF